MENLISTAELDELGEGLVKSYLGDREVKEVDIEDFISSYLKLPIRYETIAEADEGKIGFISDGRTPLWVSRKEGPVQEVFDETTIVIDRYLLNDGERSRRRFTLAHEASHYLLERLGSAQSSAEFCREYDSDREYSGGDLAEHFNLIEWQANNLAAALLMPGFLLRKSLEIWNDGNPVAVYGKTILTCDSRMKIRGMADRLGVSQTALMIQLRKHKLLEHHDLGEFIKDKLQIGGAS